MRVLAQQVFLLDSQKIKENLEDQPDLLSQSNRSVILILSEAKEVQKDKEEDDLTRFVSLLANVKYCFPQKNVKKLIFVSLISKRSLQRETSFSMSFRDIVVGLVSHQLILQLATTLLLHDRQLMLGNGVASLLMKSVAATSTSIRGRGNALFMKIKRFFVQRQR